MDRLTAKSFAILMFLSSGTATHADSLQDELRLCRDLTDDDARLICYDAAMDRNEQDAYGRPASASTKQPGPAPVGAANAAAGAGAAAATGAEVSLSQEDLFGKSSDEVERTVELVTGDQRIDGLSATVTRLQQYGYDKALITLDNGQIWKQVDGSNLRLRVGDAVNIERASLGSFMLRKQGSKRSMRVSRED